ncbi:unnamed protein product [Hyaloperonospora brassicae]|uniref:RxLR effector candidate protein n=1 Tax=Hyaloperonospora brassicae TaxID=162125 RepID=A0AAV0UR26_HYABA|nr:unnamed protein product [Hyaloperonospora brassicae]
MRPTDATPNAYAHLNANLSAPPQTHIHPIALALGIAGFFCLLFLVSASSYQKHQLQVLARKLLRKKRKSVADEDRFGAVTSRPVPKPNHTGTSTGSRQSTAASASPHPTADLPSFVRHAAETGNARVVKRWIHSPNRYVDAASAENLTALHYAVRSGHNECTRLLLAAHADPNAADERRVTPLHLAALGGHALCVKLLLDSNADPLLVDVDDHTPLYIAEQSGNIGCARLLQRAMAKAVMQDEASTVTLRAGASTARVDNAV